MNDNEAHFDRPKSKSPSTNAEFSENPPLKPGVVLRPPAPQGSNATSCKPAQNQTANNQGKKNR